MIFRNCFLRACYRTASGIVAFGGEEGTCNGFEVLLAAVAEIVCVSAHLIPDAPALLLVLLFERRQPLCLKGSAS